MNCERCNTTIDYRFLTKCANCELEQVDPSTADPIPDFQAVQSIQRKRSWTKPVVNILYLLVSSMAGLVSGAVVIYFGTAIVCIAFLPSTGNPTNDCAIGSAIAALSILMGAFLGTIGGSVFAVKNPLCKPSGQ